MEFIDLKAQYKLIEEEVKNRINTVLSHGKFIMGPEVFELEEKLAEYTGSKHCVAVSSGTDALLISLLALDIGAGDEVITTPFTFFSTGEMIALIGAKPVYVDIDPETYNIDPAKIEAAITPKTRAIMPVSLYGQCADFEAINKIAEKSNLSVIEDGAQSFGATYQNRMSCNLSTIGCTSFFPSKPLGGYGDSGACFTNDENLAKVMREIRVHGQDRRYHHPRVGINGRMDTLQAAILLSKLDIFPQEVKLREENGTRYNHLIGEHCQNITPPHINAGNTSVYAQYTVLTDDRDKVIKHLSGVNIPTAIHYPVPLNKQPALQTNEYDLSVADSLSDRVMSLPMHPYLSENDQLKIIKELSIIR